MKSPTLTSSAARSRRSSVIHVEPRRMLSAMVPVKRKGSCRTTPKRRRRVVQVLLADVDAVDEDAAALDVVEAHHQAGDGGLAGAGVADDGGGLVGLDGEADAARIHSMSAIGAQVVVGGGCDAGALCLVELLVGEPDVAELDAAGAVAGDGMRRARRSRAAVSSSLKMRSLAAMAACRMLYLSLRSWMGRKKRCAYWMKAMRMPRVTVAEDAVHA